jgi:putative spermidine/putrescine transport system permease protein
MTAALGRLRLAPVVASITIAFAVTPSLLVLVTSFGAGENLEFPPHELTLSAYGDFVGDANLREALFRSLAVGLLAVLIAVPAGVPAALALGRYRMRAKSAFTGVLLLGLASPLVVSGVAFLLIYIEAGLLGSLLPLALAIAIVNLPFVVMITASSVESLNPELDEAAHTLGAEGLQTFLFVTLPAIMPAIVASGILVFIFGITEFMISILITTVDDATLPVVIFGSLRGGLSPRLAAAGGVYIGISLLVIWCLARLGTLERFFFRSD